MGGSSRNGGWVPRVGPCVHSGWEPSRWRVASFSLEIVEMLEEQEDQGLMNYSLWARCLLYKYSFIGTVMHPTFIYCLWPLSCFIGVVEYSRSSNDVLFNVILLYVILL